MACAVSVAITGASWVERRPTSEVKKAAHEEGMRFLRESAVEKVMIGQTTLREINKVTFVE